MMVARRTGAGVRKPSQRRSLLKRDSPQRLLQKGRPASPSEPTAIGELLPSFAGIEKRNCEDFADGACRPFDAGPSESFAGNHLVGLSTNLKNAIEIWSIE